MPLIIIGIIIVGISVTVWALLRYTEKGEAIKDIIVGIFPEN